MKFDKKFKEAISHLESQEKDKLIFRLLKYDLNLANRLYFELLSTKTVDEKRAVIETRIKNKVIQMTDHFYSPGYLMMDLRDLSGEITEHVSITKDKFGEASLNLLMLNEVLRLNNKNIQNTTPGKSYKLCLYIIARAFKILILVKTLDEDYFTEFENKLNQLGEVLSQNSYLMNTAIKNGFDVNWLLHADIPDDIKEIHKTIRSQGFLK